MPNELGRVQVIMTGYTGAPGLSYFAFQGAVPGTFTQADATAAVAAVRAFLLSAQTAYGSVVTLQVQPAVTVVDWVTGALVGVRAAAGVASVAGTQIGNLLVAEGPLLQLFTSTVIGRRALRGRIFMTPYGTNGITAAGTVLASVIASVQGAANTLIGAAGVTWSVWHRPTPYATGNNGTVGAVQSAIVPGKVAVLRSRRD